MPAITGEEKWHVTLGMCDVVLTVGNDSRGGRPRLGVRGSGSRGLPLTGIALSLRVRMAFKATPALDEDVIYVWGQVDSLKAYITALVFSAGILHLQTALIPTATNSS